MDNNSAFLFFFVAEKLIAKDFFQESTGTESIIAFRFYRVWVLVKL